jgi:small GTP-binding protein
MLDRKICMLGAFAVGKTSLVQRFVTSLFSEQYQTTIGVKVDKKTVAAGDRAVNLVIWDLYGEDDYQKLRLSYLRGSAGYLLVIDGMRRATLEVALHLQRTAADALGPVPFVVVVNKADLSTEWEVTEREVAELAQRGWLVVTASAKAGQGVEQAFSALAHALAGEKRTI